VVKRERKIEGISIVSIQKEQRIEVTAFAGASSGAPQFGQ
jgi:hypothetical protein